MTTAAGDAGAAGAGAAGAGAAGAGDAAAVAAAAAAAASAGAAQWHGYTDATDVAYVGNKGWKGPQDVVKSYRDAERLIGRDPSTLLVLPRADDPAGLRTVLGKLGMPEKADAYELDTPKGAQPNAPFQTWAKGAFHKIGLLPAQAKELSTAYNAFLAEQSTAIEGDYKTKVTADKQALLKEWGAGHERMMNVAKGAAQALGFTGEMIDAIEQHVGYAATQKFFAAIGQKMSEDVFPTGEGKKNFDGAMLTPAEAKTQWDQKKLDPNFTKALSDKSHPGHAVAQAEQTRLFKIMYPEG